MEENFRSEFVSADSLLMLKPVVGKWATRITPVWPASAVRADKIGKIGNRQRQRQKQKQRQRQK